MQFSVPRSTKGAAHLQLLPTGNCISVFNQGCPSRAASAPSPAPDHNRSPFSDLCWMPIRESVSWGSQVMSGLKPHVLALGQWWHPVAGSHSCKLTKLLSIFPRGRVVDSADLHQNSEPLGHYLVRKWTENYQEKDTNMLSNKYIKRWKFTLRKSCACRFLNKQDDRCPRTCLSFSLMGIA